MIAVVVLRVRRVEGQEPRFDRLANNELNPRPAWAVGEGEAYFPLVLRSGIAGPLAAVGLSGGDARLVGVVVMSAGMRLTGIVMGWMSQSDSPTFAQAR